MEDQNINPNGELPNNPPPSTELADNQFEFEGKVYEAIKGAAIPVLGKRTAAEIAEDPEAQKYLVENGCSAVKEIE